MRYMKNPNGFCFVAGTLVLTAIGLTCIEDIRPGDYVYAKNEITGEQDYMPVLETFENEVTELCTVTIDGNSIETTPGHKFYTPDNGWVSACDLNKGDTVELSDGSSVEVDNVETTELDEPITVYNFNVMDYHTYYVGESEVLVHNTKCTDLKVDDGISVKSGSTTELPWSSKAVSDASSKLDNGAKSIFVDNRSQAEELFLGKYQGKGYTNVTGMDAMDAKNLLGGKGNTYHWDDTFGSDGFLLGHGAGNSDATMPHLQIHPKKGNIIRIFFGTQGGN